MKLEALVEEFASEVAAQTEALARGRPGTGNRHARRYGAAWERLRAQGPAGLEALATLLTHARSDVRVLAASFLLRGGHREAQARAVLEAAAQGQGLSALGAAQTLRQWREGTLAPVPEAEAPAEPARVTRRARPDPGQPLVLPASLEPHRALLRAALASCVLFDLEVGGPQERGCRYGGLPLLPPGTSWPASPEGPLHFVGQLDFEELAACCGQALPELPRKGLLAFFYDVENQPWGREPADRAFWRLLYVPPGEPLAPLQPPAELMDAERSVLPPCRLLPLLGLSLPDFWDRRAALPTDSWSEAEAEDYVELRRTLAGGATPHQLLGHPAWVQEDARPELEGGAAAWRLLWQVGSDEAPGFMWGGAGTLYVLIQDGDLRECRFDRARLILQSG